jgi:hypothetical protein
MNDGSRVGTSIGHGEETGLGVLSLEILVCEFLAINGLAAGALRVDQLKLLSNDL